ncbi:MAG: TetR/AcrR family transcriptional regulator [Sphingomonas sp.]|uniref:TetR/AcrR family transcriptional regulator n=1 Tax=Sphingomonas sp. TaxID=28214 RepID=UPI001AD128EF|nr:TetR/AcrR family transcriptional regulator [Sphingomonas sp.]MBN8808710.1 TetR/AcrR family transcriptional regulator [Sphingomonas sp.]
MPFLRQEKILDAAATLFRERGFAAISIDEIGTAAGTTGPGVYKYFPSKGALLAEILERAIYRMRVDFARVLLVEGTPIERLERIVTAYVDVTEPEARAVVLGSRDFIHLPEERKPALRASYHGLREAFVDALVAVRPDMPRQDAKVTVMAVFGGLLTSVALLSRPISGERKRRIYVPMAMAALIGLP